jgi:hypothetical protein
MEAHGDRPAHHRLVAEVEAIEVAERDDRAAKLSAAASSSSATAPPSAPPGSSPPAKSTYTA